MFERDESATGDSQIFVVMTMITKKVMGGKSAFGGCGQWVRRWSSGVFWRSLESSLGARALQCPVDPREVELERTKKGAGQSFDPLFGQKIVRSQHKQKDVLFEAVWWFTSSRISSRSLSHVRRFAASNLILSTPTKPTAKTTFPSDRPTFWSSVSSHHDLTTHHCDSATVLLPL